MINQVVAIIRDEKQWTRVRLALPFWGFGALQGLLVFRNLPSTEGTTGILCFPCRFVWMMGVGFAIDVVYCNRDKEIILIIEGLVPHKVGPYLKNSFFVLILPAETAFRSGLKVGERLKW